MEFFDDVLTKARDVFDTAYKKTEKVVAAGKQRIDISSMKGAIAKRYEKLGREVIGEIEDAEELPENIAATIADIREREALLRLAESELEQVAGKRMCLNCGASNHLGAKFCSTCGAEIK